MMIMMIMTILSMMMMMMVAKKGHHRCQPTASRSVLISQDREGTGADRHDPLMIIMTVFMIIFDHDQ